MNEARFVETFLRMKFPSSASNGDPLVIKQRLSVEVMFNQTEEEFAASLIRDARGQEESLVEAVREFSARNGGENMFETIGSIDLPHVLLKEEEFSALFNMEGWVGWEEFYKLYPGSPGIITLSRPGFSRDDALAVIYMGHNFDWEGGSGQIHVLERHNEKWVESSMGIGPAWIV